MKSARGNRTRCKRDSLVYTYLYFKTTSIRANKGNESPFTLSINVNIAMMLAKVTENKAAASPKWVATSFWSNLPGILIKNFR